MGEVSGTPLLDGWVARTLEGYPEHMEDHDNKPSHHPADGADDDGKDVEWHLVRQEQVGQHQEDQPDYGVGYKPTYESHALDRALNA